MLMSWDRSARPKRLRRKHKRIVLLAAIVGSIMIVSITGFWDEISGDDSFSVLGYVTNFFSDEEKQTVWHGLSDEGKAIIQKHIPSTK